LGNLSKSLTFFSGIAASDPKVTFHYACVKFTAVNVSQKKDGKEKHGRVIIKIVKVCSTKSLRLDSDKHPHRQKQATMAAVQFARGQSPPEREIKRMAHQFKPKEPCKC